ncbi:MAG: 50S ribosomal protein L4 [Candidatus Komeilibacteria bacterium]|nr:50S ribosomal protein L4 [Candidatus Komeilibacteria bacterium]
MKVKVYNLAGEVLRDEELDAKFFGITPKPEVIQQAVEAQLANARTVLAHAKGRAEVRGGGKKPWKQKGTGRARHGSSRSPIWVGGGVTFGPTKERNFKLDINKKAKKRALQMVLSDKLNNERLILVDELTVEEPKTKKFNAILQKLPLKGKSALVVLDKKNENIVISARNLPKVLTEGVDSLNVVDLLKYEYLLMPVKAVSKIVKHYSI